MCGHHFLLLPVARPTAIWFRSVSRRLCAAQLGGDGSLGRLGLWSDLCVAGTEPAALTLHLPTGEEVQGSNCCVPEQFRKFSATRSPGLAETRK